MKKILLCITIILILTGLSLFRAYKSQIKNFEMKISMRQTEIESLKREIFFLDKKIKSCEESNKKETVEQEPELKYSIDIEEKKCIETTSVLDYANCYYESGEKWKKEISKILNQLQKVMNEDEYKIIKEGQYLWNKSVKKDTEIIDEYISSKSGVIHSTIGSSIISDLYKGRYLLLKEIYYNYYEEDKDFNNSII